MTIIKLSDISNIKMVTNPPKCVIEAGNRVIVNDEVKEWVGIGWITLRKSTQEDKKYIPIVPKPHCSLCEHYETLHQYLYCKHLKRQITARKQPCKYYQQF